MSNALVLQGLQVLVADDDEHAAADLRTLLERDGASVRHVAMDELQKTLRASVTRVVIVAAETDGHGLALADAVREQADLSAIRLVIGTAQISRETLERHARTLTGADGYLRKPWDENRVRACLTRLSQGPTGPDERLWWLDDRSESLCEPPGASGSLSGSPIGIPGFKP